MDQPTEVLRYPAPKLGIAFSSSAQLYVAPAEVIAGPFAKGMLSADRALPLAGGEQAFCSVRLAARDADKISVYHLNVKEAPGLHASSDAALEVLQKSLPEFAGLSMRKAHVMGIINVTPDSFSSHGEHFAATDAISGALQMCEAGATIIDVGGESTRPGADVIPPDEEIRRVDPVVRELANRGICVSIDTRNSMTMAHAVSAGAKIINDVTGLSGDPNSLKVAGSSGASIVLMHMQGQPQTMQANPSYDFAAFDIYDYLQDRLRECQNYGISLDRLCIDPGIGFGKTVEHNLSIMRWWSLYRSLGVPLLLGASRKSLIQHVCGETSADKRLAGSLSLAVQGVRDGANIVRVHDVAETCQALDMLEAVQTAE